MGMLTAMEKSMVVGGHGGRGWAIGRRWSPLSWSDYNLQVEHGGMWASLYYPVQFNLTKREVSWKFG